MFITPFHMRAWLESGDTERIETLVSATAPLSVALARTAEERTGAKLYEIYGCTEAGQVATRRTTQSPMWEAYDGLRVWTEGDQAMVAGGHVEQPTKLMDIIEPRGDGTRFLLCVQHRSRRRCVGSRYRARPRRVRRSRLAVVVARRKSRARFFKIS